MESVAETRRARSGDTGGAGRTVGFAKDEPRASGRAGRDLPYSWVEDHLERLEAREAREEYYARLERESF